MACHLLSEFDDNTMVNDTVNGSCGGHGVFEDLIPLGKDQIGSDHHTATLIALSQLSKENFHFVAGLLDITDVIQDE
jgi:hypothetical protein